MTQKENLDNPRLRYPCPKCGAEGGFPCKTSSGFDTYQLHADRPMDLDQRRTSSRQHKVRQLDITAPVHGVQVEVREDGTVLWVSVDGITMLRVCQIPRLEIQDHRTVRGVRRAGANTTRGRVKAT